MFRTHPHAGATYRLIAAEGGFSVEVVIPDTHPAKVSGFATQADAEAWIERHKSEIEQGEPSRRRTMGGRRPSN